LYLPDGNTVFGGVLRFVIASSNYYLFFTTAVVVFVVMGSVLPKISIYFPP